MFKPPTFATLEFVVSNDTSGHGESGSGTWLAQQQLEESALIPISQLLGNGSSTKVHRASQSRQPQPQPSSWDSKASNPVITISVPNMERRSTSVARHNSLSPRDLVTRVSEQKKTSVVAKAGSITQSHPRPIVVSCRSAADVVLSRIPSNASTLSNSTSLTTSLEFYEE